MKTQRKTKYVQNTPSELVRRAAATCPASDKLISAINILPALSELCENLALMVSDVIPTRDDKESLLNASIREAWMRYREVEKTSADVVPRITAFAQGLTSRLDEINEVRVHVISGAHPIAWKPSPERLHDFLARYPGLTPIVTRERYANVDSHTCRQMIASRVIDLTQIRAMGGSLDLIIAAHP